MNCDWNSIEETQEIAKNQLQLQVTVKTHTRN